MTHAGLQENFPLVELYLACRWETGSPIPGLPLETPDHSYNLFHQKLQLINCCIDRKVARERRERGGGKSAQSETEEDEEDKGGQNSNL